ncbi:MAG: right-handed parallel beta-helix repeat-containing protein, partial [bacterium]|nr:right-handed parallel beta-helix repeat-containing protein [Candidatus Kapabacteria bacterium]
MKLVTLLLLILIAPILSARTIEVSPGGTYPSLRPAALAAQPGDSIVIRAGVYAGGEHIVNLQGNADRWIVIAAALNETVTIRGGGNAWQFSDPAYLRIQGIDFEGQTGNGVNIDDGGTIESPAHHIFIVGCHWRAMNASGNNDQLKMSGVDSFTVANNIFEDGSTGGSMIDMVGCHNGLFSGNIFERAGSNCIQAKGGTRYIRIERNRFVEGGGRAINIGGSTGLEFFRPLGANYEAQNIAVFSNIFIGADAPIAFVGAINSIVANNTIWMPERWAIRILQETTEPNFVQCGDNAFINNIVVLDNRADNPTLNVGSNTRPETFSFRNNLWYNVENASWSGPNLPTPESNGIIGRDPVISLSNATPPTGSPAIGAGLDLSDPAADYNQRRFLVPRSIGAIEGGSPALIARPARTKASPR